MKTIICLALCLLAVSALSPIEDLPTALDILDMQNLLDDCKGFDLSASFTYLGGADSDSGSDSYDTSDSSSSDVPETVTIQGTYNLLTYEDGKGKVKTGTFNKTKDFTTQGVVNFTGSGAFNARGGGDDWKGFFNGGSSTDFVFETDGGYAFGLRVHEFGGEFKGKKSWGFGKIDVNTWQDVNTSSNQIEYGFGGDKESSRYAGNSKASAEVTTDDTYKVFAGSVFHGENSKKNWQVSGGYVVDAYNSNWENVYSKDGNFSKSGSCDDALGTFSMLRAFNLPRSESISK